MVDARELPPRRETQEERDKAYADLRKKINRKLHDHGVPAMIIPIGAVFASGKTRDFYSPTYDEYFKLQKTVADGIPTIILGQYEIDERDVMEETQICSYNNGSFTRSEFSAKVHDENTPERQIQEDIKNHLAANVGAVDQGLTGLPITAAEANYWVSVIEDAQPRPDMFGRPATL